MSLELIRAVRARTGATMVHCKIAVADAGGNLEMAVALIEERGQAIPENLEDPAGAKAAETPEPHAKVMEPEVPVPSPEDEESLLIAIRGQDHAGAIELLQQRTVISVRVLLASLAQHGVGLSHAVGLAVPQLASSGHTLARAIGSSYADPKLRAALLDRVLEAMPPGLARTDALRIGVGTVGGDRVAPAMANASVARKNLRCGVAVRDLALLMSNNDRVEAVRECASHEEALSVVETWVGAPPTRPSTAPASTVPESPPAQLDVSGENGDGWSKKWSARTEFGDYPRPIVQDGVVWCLVRGESIYAHDLATGETRWEAPFEGAMHGVTLSPTLVFITCSSGVLGLRRDDGAELWSRTIDHKMWVDSSPLIDGARGFHLSHGGVHALCLDDGHELWHVRCAVRDRNTLIDLGSRLLLPTHTETLIIDKDRGEVVERLPIQGDLAAHFGGERPAVLIARAGQSRFHWLCLDDGSHGSAEFTSVSDEYGTALPIDRLAVSGSRVFATSLDWASRFCFDLDLATGTVQLVRESPGEQYWTVCVDDGHAYTYANGRVDVLDLMLRPIGSFEAGTGGGVCPRIVPTDRGVFVSSDSSCAYFERPATEASAGPGERTFTEGLAAPVLAQLERLSGVHPKSARQRVFQTPSGPVELSGPLSLYLGVTWMAEGLLCGEPLEVQRPIHLYDGELAEDQLARDYDGPLVVIGHDDYQWYYVIRAHDESTDPVVYMLDHDGSEGLADGGERLSVFLSKLVPKP